MEGTIPFPYKGETFQTYYKVFGDFKNRERTPLVVLHGGPGLSHDYLVPFADLTAKFSIPVILYDQLGNARSTHLKDKPPTFWTVDLFMDELSNLLQHFSIQDSFDLVGHSWGGVLAAEFAVQKQPTGLKHLILTNSLAASSLWNKSNMQLLQGFPQDVQEGIAAGMKDPAKFSAALEKYYAVHGCTVNPFPKEYTATLDTLFGPNGDLTVASAPILQNWSIVDRLHAVTASALVINGRKDVAQDFVVEPFFRNIPQAKWITFENSSHMPFWEERERYMQVVGEFLTL
ncbi:proline iminopeptidase [Flammula alnicola]|nr:proline iminopeptidase [Flammula alnicola]